MHRGLLEKVKHKVKSGRVKNNQIEAKEQTALFQWREYNLYNYPGIDLMFATLNGAYLQGTPQQRARQWLKLLKQGARKGVLDIFLPVAKGAYHGLWLEMKAPKPHRSSVTTEQKEWQQRMRNEGYMARIVYGCEEAIAAIDAYYNAPGAV
ncbi:MAG TPA: hypothetical protein ENJ08_05830 [Gammaproteobacteria bacterium]|nr:hypothetical protein [Gammaproteobacteria bacterium]